MTIPQPGQARPVTDGGQAGAKKDLILVPGFLILDNAIFQHPESDYIVPPCRLQE